jgi:hypothetical protein
VTRHGYEIGAKGRVPTALLEEIGAVAPVLVPTETVLITGEIDQHELHYLIKRISDIGLELCDLRQVALCDDPAAPVDEASMS